MEELLLICTSKAPFRCPQGKLYVQHDGIAMGSPLGVLFANAFMSAIEEVFRDNDLVPQIYCRYIDDLFVCARSQNQIEELSEVAAGL